MTTAYFPHRSYGERTCDRCGQTFTATSKVAKYCRAVCRLEARDRRRVVTKQGTK
jgi:hypothetical protein